MSTNQEFLSPRNLLIKGSFCCQGPSFQELYNALLSSENLPASETQICQRSGLTDTGLQAIYTRVWPIIEKFQETQRSSLNLRIGYRKVTDVCDRTLDIASTVKADYDEIFSDLEKLFHDPDNETLRQNVNKTIQDRVYNIGVLASIANNTTDLVRSSTLEIIGYQLELHQLSKALGSSDVEGLLRHRDLTEEDVQNDLAALSIIQGIISDQDMKDQSAASISNLEILVGAVGAIMSDLKNLSQSIEESAQPGPGLLLGVEKEKLLEMWDLLKNEVQQFKDRYTI